MPRRWLALATAIAIFGAGAGDALSKRARPSRAGSDKAAGSKAASGKAGDQVEIEIHRWTLPNGLEVVYAPHRRVPAVTVQVWYHVGSKNERVGIRGVAHMFEHMMFKGSQHVPPEQHAQLLARVGGTVNAFTTMDVTAYHDTLPRQYFDFAVKLEAERMRNLLITDKAINSEREVVKEEKRLRMDNSPIGRALEAIHDLAYTRHPYAWTPAGDIGDLDKTVKATYQKFYKRYYAPNNATLVVVGDVDESEVREVAKRYFGDIKRGDPVPRVQVKEPPQKELRLQRGDWPSQLNVVLGAYHIPAARDPDTVPLSVLSAILSAGNSSRLYQALVRKRKLAVATGGFVRELEDPGLFLIYAIGLPTHDLEKMRSVLLAEIERVAKQGVREAELQKAKAQLTTAHLHGLQTVSGIAQQIGMSRYVHGDPRAFLKDLERLRAVRTADVQQVAKHYLHRKNLSLVVLPAGRGVPGGAHTRKAAPKRKPAPKRQAPKGGRR